MKTLPFLVLLLSVVLFSCSEDDASPLNQVGRNHRSSGSVTSDSALTLAIPDLKDHLDALAKGLAPLANVPSIKRKIHSKLRQSYWTTDSATHTIYVAKLSALKNHLNLTGTDLKQEIKTAYLDHFEDSTIINAALATMEDGYVLQSGDTLFPYLTIGEVYPALNLTIYGVFHGQFRFSATGKNGHSSIEDYLVYVEDTSIQTVGHSNISSYTDDHWQVFYWNTNIATDSTFNGYNDFFDILRSNGMPCSCFGPAGDPFCDVGLKEGLERCGVTDNEACCPFGCVIAVDGGDWWKPSE